MARIISKPHNNFFNYSCGVNIWEPSTSQTHAERQPPNRFQLKQSLKFEDCWSIKGDESEDGARTKEILTGVKVKKEKGGKGKGLDRDSTPWNDLPQGDKNRLHKQWAKAKHNTFMTMGVTGAGKGGGVLDKAIVERVTPGRESEFDLRKSGKMSPPYRVLLHNDNFNKREYVVQVLMKVIPGMMLDNAVTIMQEAHHNGMSVVIVCGQADAEEYCKQLRGNGLFSSIEPTGHGGGSSC